MSAQNLAAALVAAQADMPAVEPDATNPHYKTKFVSLDHLIAKTRPVLNRHGLAIVQLPATNDAGLAVLRTILWHGPSGERVEADSPLMLGKNDMQGLGAAITYARRYAWASALGIASDEDDDGEAAAAGRREEAHGEASSPRPRSEQPSSSRPPTAGDNDGKITKAQHAKIAVLVKELDETQTPLPGGYLDAEGWVSVLKNRLAEAYGVDSRTKLTAKQASDLIDWLDSQGIPF